VSSVSVLAGEPGDDEVALVASAGLILDPPQEEIIRAASVRKPDGRLKAFEVGVNWPRQNGKGGILEARVLIGLFLWGERYIIWSAHNFDTSRESFGRVEDLIREAPALHAQVKRSDTGKVIGYRHSHGEEGIELQNGARIRFRTRTKGGGKGFTADCVIFDEAMFLNEAFHWALLPTLSAKSMFSSPQVWYTGSAADELVHENAIVWARVRERGLAGEDESLLYFERSACGPGIESPEDVTPEMAVDPVLIEKANQALGKRISLEHVLREQRSMDPRGYAVERLGVGAWPRTDGLESTMVHPEAWLALLDDMSVLVDPVCLAFDVAPDRSSAAIAAAGSRPDEFAHLEVVEHRRGVGWVVDRLVELDERHAPLEIVCDKFGPAGSLLPELEKRGVRVRSVTGTEYGQSCGLFVDVVNQKRLRHLGSQELLNAIRGSRTRQLGDAWAWSRKSSATDICPLVAATLALGSFLGEFDDGEDPVIY
jgi:hypothetical protein